MAPITIVLSDLPAGAQLLQRRDNNNTFGDWRDVDQPEAYIIEAWGEGFMLGGLLIMAVITVANMRKGVLLHKLILLELLFAMSHGTFCFMAFYGYGWYLSSTAALLYCSYFTHNVVAWLKIRPFFTGNQATFSPRVCKWVTRIFLGTLALTAPALIFEIYNNFRFFNNINTLYERVRPFEPLMRDPWWIFSCSVLFHVVRKCYSLNLFRLMQRSPRFAILVAAICISLTFTVMDVLASVISSLSYTDGINPYWKLAVVFKCLSDNIILDDFKSVLQRLGAVKLDCTNSLRPDDMKMSAIGSGMHGDRSLQPWSDSSLPPNGRTGRMTSLSGRPLDDGEVLDTEGRARRRQSMAARGIGKFGMKISSLPRLASFCSKAEREAKKNAESNKKISVCDASEANDSEDGRPQWNMKVFAPIAGQSSVSVPHSACPSPNGDGNAQNVQPEWEHLEIGFITTALPLSTMDDKDCKT